MVGAENGEFAIEEGAQATQATQAAEEQRGVEDRGWKDLRTYLERFMTKLKAILLIAVLVCVVIFVNRSTPGDDRLEQEPAENAQSQYEQTQGGVTVRIEKITFERVTNGPAWFRRQYGADWRKYVWKDFQNDSFRIIRVFVSETPPGKDRTFSFELGRGSQVGSHGVAEFDPKVWQRQLPDLDVDPAARGIIFWARVKDDATIEDLFPGEVKFDVTTENGKTFTFQFNNLTL